MWERAEPLVFGVAVVAWALIAAGFFVFHEQLLGSTKQTATPSLTAAAPAPAPAAAAPSKEQLAPPPRHMVVAGTLAILAARGDSWLVVRRGSATGPVLYQGLLQDGRAFRVKGKSFWTRFAAAANLDVLVNGRRMPNLIGTIDVTLRAQRRVTR